MELLEKALIISLFCVGLRIVSSKGMILSWLRFPYESINKEIKFIRKLNKQKKWLTQEENLFSGLLKICYVLNMAIIRVILKAVIGCVVCMGSFWTIIIELTYFKLSLSTLLLIFIVCAMNGIIYAMYELISAMINYYTKKS